MSTKSSSLHPVGTVVIYRYGTNSYGTNIYGVVIGSRAECYNTVKWFNSDQYDNENLSSSLIPIGDI